MRFLIMLLSLLLCSTDANLDYIKQEEPQSAFGFPDFTVSRKLELNFGGKARLGNTTIRNNVVELTPDADNYENTLRNANADVKGSVFYKTPIHLINRYTSASFKSVFAFAMKPVYPSNTGDGIAFIITSNPQANGDSLGNFGFFHHGKKKHTTLAIEFDTFKNHELSDMDNNHVGVDIGDPVSIAAISANNLGITLNSGRPVTAWVEYYAPLQRLEVRMQIGLSHSRPEKPLIALPLSLKQVMREDMWVGLSAGTHYGYNQLHYIYSWSFSVDYITPDHKHLNLNLSRDGKIILIVVLSGSFLILSVSFILFRLYRHYRHPRVQDEGAESKSRGNKLADTALHKDDAEPEEMPTRATQVEGWDEEQYVPGVMANCLPTHGCLPRVMSSPRGDPRGGDSPRSDYHQSDDTILYSNSVYNSEEGDNDLIPDYPYDAYPVERIDSIAYSTPKPDEPANPQFKVLRDLENRVLQGDDELSS